MAGDVRCEGIHAEGLADGARGAAMDAASEGGVGDDLASRDALQRDIDAGGERGNPGGVFSFQCSVFAESWRWNRLALAILSEH